MKYTTTAMSNIWSNETKYQTWELIETLYLQGILGREITVKENSSQAKDIKVLEETTKHETVAFLQELESRLENEDEKKHLHFGLTSSDIIDTANAYLIKQSMNIILDNINSLLTVADSVATKYLMKAVGRTHGKHAEMINWNSRLNSFIDELNEAKFQILANRIIPGKMTGPVGTGTFVNLEASRFLFEKLGLTRCCFTTQVVPRYHYSNVIYACVCVMNAMERLATNIRLSAINEIDEIQEGFSAGQTGSSAMPHKNNPVISERICGLARKIRGNLHSMLESNALWFERDISHSSVERLVLPETFQILHYSLETFENLLNNLIIKEDNIKRNLENANIDSHRRLLQEQLETSSRKESYVKVQDETQGCN